MQHMTCKQLIEFLDEYHSGDLDSGTRAAFDSHLNACRACRDYLYTYRETITLARMTNANFDDLVPKSVPDELVRAVEKATQQRMMGE